MHEENCIFCKIVAGDVPNHTIYEDSEFLAFLDIRPLSPGHTLVIPKNHHRWVWDVENDGDYFAIAKKIALALQRYTNVDAVHAKIVGEEVPHAHIWVYADPSASFSIAKDATAETATALRAFVV